MVSNGLVTCDLQSTTTTTTMARSPNMTMGEVVHSLPLRAAPPPHTQPKPKAPASRAAGMWATSSPSLPRVGPLGNLKSQPPAWLAAGQQRQVPASHPWLSYFFCPALPPPPPPAPHRHHRKPNHNHNLKSQSPAWRVSGQKPRVADFWETQTPSPARGWPLGKTTNNATTNGPTPTPQPKLKVPASRKAGLSVTASRGGLLGNAK